MRSRREICQQNRGEKRNRGDETHRAATLHKTRYFDYLPMAIPLEELRHCSAFTRLWQRGALLFPDELNVRRGDVAVCVHITAEVLRISVLPFVHLRLMVITLIDDPIAVDVPQKQAQADGSRV